jgi:hypothetical protein
VSEQNNLQLQLLEAAGETNHQLARIADCLEALFDMIVAVQPKELAKKAHEHKKAQANLRKESKKNE